MTPTDGQRLRYGSPFAPLFDEIYEPGASYQQKLAEQRSGADVTGARKLKRRRSKRKKPAQQSGAEL